MSLRKIILYMHVCAIVKCKEQALLPHPIKYAQLQSSKQPLLQRTQKPTVRFAMMSSAPTSHAICSKNFFVLGRDARLLRELALHTGNMQGCIQSGIQRRLENGTEVGALTDIITGKADIYGVSSLQSTDLDDVLEYLYPHTQGDLCILVPKAKFKVHSSLDTFSRNTWLATMGTLILFTVVLSLTTGKMILVMVVDTLGTFITGSFSEKEEKLTLYTLCWLSWFSLLMVNSFTGKFMSFLAVPSAGDEIETLEDIVQQLRVVYTSSGAKTHIQMWTDHNDVAWKLAEKFAYTSFWKHQLQDWAISRDVGFAQARGNLEFIQLLPGATSPEGHGMFRIARQCITSPTFWSFPTRKGWEHREYFSSLLQRLVEAGVADKFHQNMWDEWRPYYNLSRVYLKQNIEQMLPEPLQQRHLRDPLFVWGLGITISIITLAIEYFQTFL